jgi:hypothetical protein
MVAIIAEKLDLCEGMISLRLEQDLATTPLWCLKSLVVMAIFTQWKNTFPGRECKEKP